MLAVIALLSQVPKAPPVELNHFYITVSRPTWKAIQSSRWLKQTFANVSTSTHSSGKDTWTGIYVNGIGSFVEIFGTGGDFKEGQAGIGFLTPTPGGADTVDFLFRKGYFGKRAERELMQLGSKDKQEPFAHLASFAGQDPMLNIWVMEYHEQFLHEIGLPTGATHAQMSAATRKKDHRPYAKMMGDITALTVTRGRPDLDHALELMGYRDGKQGRSEIRFAPRASYAITEARFSLRKRPSKSHTERFGPHCWLKVEPNGEAVWKFG